MTKLATAALCAAFLVLGAAPSQAQAPAPPPPADYSNDANWLCRPGRTDACTQDAGATIIAPSGQLTAEPFTANPDAPIDCFYVYPTVSLEPTPNADLQINASERAVARAHLERFTSQCRPFAPVYRQMTLAGLAAVMRGDRGAVDRALPYNDVLAAWRYYLEHDNHGRGVVLLGHSQGAGILVQLIKNEIDGKPAQARLISAIITGANVIVPPDADVGGSFQHIPACRAPTQIGCVISYVSFRATSPPPPNAFFGKPFDIQTSQVSPGMRALCTNPANLAGGAGELHSYFRPGQTVWTNPPQQITSAFVNVPGLVSAECKSDERGTYLSVTVNADPADPRTDDIPGDVRTNGQIDPAWGLHLVEIPEAMGDLVEIVRQQSEAYRSHR